MSVVPKILGNRLHLSALGVLLVFVVAVAYLFSAVLDQPLASRPDRVTIELAGTGGLFEGSAATYRGVKVGKVTDISLTPTGVEATVALTSGTRIPASTTAAVRSLSPVGEQYVDFQPTTTGAPYLHDGSRIAAGSTDLPKSLASTVVAVNGVLRQVDDRHLHSLLGELSTGLAGTGEDIGRIVDQGDRVLAALDRAWPQTQGLIEGSGPALDIPTSQAGDLEQFATSANRFAQFLRSYDPELRKQLHRSPRQLAQMTALIDDWAAVLPRFFPVFTRFARIITTHDPHFRATLQGYAKGIDALGGLLSGGHLNLELIADKDARCGYGTAPAAPRATGRPLQAGGACPSGFARLQRGAAHAPGPVSAP